MSQHISPRTLRRAAEHAARKAAARQANLQSTQQAQAAAAEPTQSFPNADSTEEPTAESTPASPRPISEARLAANRQNAQKSSGPRTDEGKARSCLNAMKNGLTGSTMLFTSEDELNRYHAHVNAYITQFQPVGPEESALVQSIADLRWKLNRIPGLEQAILASAALNLIEEDPQRGELGGESMLELTVRRRNEKELRNLHLHENRLARRRERETAELRRLQTERKSKEEESLAQAAKADLLAQHRRQPLAQIPGLGFDFSKQRYTAFMNSLNHAQRAKLLQEALAESASGQQTMETAA